MKRCNARRRLIVTLCFALVLNSAVFGDELHDAALINDVNKVKTLLASGADVNAKNQFGETPLFGAAFHNAKDVAAQLIDRGADVNAMDQSGQTPLFVAASSNANDVALLLIAKGADVNATNQYGDTPLFSATFSNAKDVAALLIDRGAHVNAKGRFGQTPLFSAAFHNARDVAALLIDKGADVNAKDQSGKTPLFRAALYKAKDVAAQLIDKGADASAKDSQGKTPREEAEENHSDDVAALLRNAMDQQESLGDAAARNGKLREAFNYYMSAMTSRVNGSDLNTAANLRIKITGVVRKLDPPPAVPEEAERHNARGAGLIEVAKSTEDFTDAANEFHQARDLAPWWPDPYSNEGIAHEKASQYEAAISCLKLYLALKPSEADARTAQNRIYALEAKMEKGTKEKEESEAAQQKENALARALVGTWYCEEQGPKGAEYQKGEPVIDVFSSARGNAIRLTRDTWTKWLNGGYALYKYSAVLSDVQIQGRIIKFRIKITQEHLQDQSPGAPTPLGLVGENTCDYDLSLSEDGKKLHGTASIHDAWNRWHVAEHNTTKYWELARHD